MSVASEPNFLDLGALQKCVWDGNSLHASRDFGLHKLVGMYNSFCKIIMRERFAI